MARYWEDIRRACPDRNQLSRRVPAPSPLTKRSPIIKRSLTVAAPFPKRAETVRERSATEPTSSADQLQLDLLRACVQLDDAERADLSGARRFPLPAGRPAAALPLG